MLQKYKSKKLWQHLIWQQFGIGCLLHDKKNFKMIEVRDHSPETCLAGLEVSSSKNVMDFMRPAWIFHSFFFLLLPLYIFAKKLKKYVSPGFLPKYCKYIKIAKRWNEIACKDSVKAIFLFLYWTDGQSCQNFKHFQCVVDVLKIVKLNVAVVWCLLKTT